VHHTLINYYPSTSNLNLKRHSQEKVVEIISLYHRFSPN
jgi:hypothetical protein